MGITAAVMGGGAIIGGLIQGNATQQAADTEANAANNATSEDMSMFNTEQGNEQPYMSSGTSALNNLNGQMSQLDQPFTMSQFQEDPGYQFDLSQGQQAIQNSSAASGHMVSSQELGNASNYSQSMASNEYGNAYNRYMNTNQATYNKLMGLVQVGQAGASNTNAAAMNTATNISNNTMAAGNASAAGQIGTANAVSGAIGGVANAAGSYGMMSNLMNNSTSSVPGYGATSSAINGMNTDANFSMPGMGASAAPSSPVYSLMGE